MSDKNHSLICPHCGFKQQWNYPEKESDQLIPCWCEECGKRFVYSVIVTRQYFSYRDEDEYYN